MLLTLTFVHVAMYHYVLLLLNFFLPLKFSYQSIVCFHLSQIMAKCIRNI